MQLKRRSEKKEELADDEKAILERKLAKLEEEDSFSKLIGKIVRLTTGSREHNLPLYGKLISVSPGGKGLAVIEKIDGTRVILRKNVISEIALTKRQENHRVRSKRLQEAFNVERI